VKATSAIIKGHTLLTKQRRMVQFIK